MIKKKPRCRVCGHKLGNGMTMTKHIASLNLSKRVGHWWCKKDSDTRELIGWTVFGAWFFIVHPAMSFLVGYLWSRDAAAWFYFGAVLFLYIARVIYVRVILGEGAQL